MIHSNIQILQKIKHIFFKNNFRILNKKTNLSIQVSTYLNIEMGCNQSQQEIQHYFQYQNLSLKKQRYDWKEDQQHQGLYGVSYCAKKFITNISQNISLKYLIGSGVWNKLKKYLEKYYWPQNSLRKLVKSLENYIKQCNYISKNYNPKQNYQNAVQDYIQKFALEINGILSQVLVQQKYLAQSVQYLQQFQKDYKFDFSEKQIISITNKIKSLCNKQMLSIVYLSQYFVKCCAKMQEDGKDTDQINKVLKQKATLLKDRFGVEKTRKQALDALGIENDNVSADQKLQGKFNQIKKIKDKGKMIKLSFGNKQEQLDNEIMSFVQFGLKNYDYFNSIVENACLDNNGFGFKSNLKLTSKQNKASLMRVKQKLLKNFIKGSKPVQGCSKIDQLVKKQQENFQQLMNNAYSNMTEVQFTVTDILRGKCLFNKKQDIYKAAARIIQRVEQEARKGKKVSVVEVDDRFKKLTQDLVFKIKIDDLVCEFQMVLYFLDVENVMHHKFYEMVRSDALSPIYILQEWNKKATNQFLSIVVYNVKFQFFNLFYEAENLVKDKIYKIFKLNFSSLKQAINAILFEPKTCQYKLPQLLLQNVKQQMPMLSEYTSVNTLKFILISKQYDLLRGESQSNTFRGTGNVYKRYVDILADLLTNSKLMLPDIIPFSFWQQKEKVSRQQGKDNAYHAKLCIYQYIQQQNSNCKIPTQIYDESIKKYIQVIKVKNSLDYAYFLNGVGIYNINLKRQEQALSFLNQALNACQSINQSSLSKRKADLLSEIYQNMVRACQEQNKHEQSLRYAKKSVQVLQKTNKQSMKYVLSLVQLGAVHQKSKNYVQALNIFNSCISLIEKKSGKYSPQNAYVSTRIAALYNELKKYELSIVFGDRAVSIYDGLEYQHKLQYCKAVLNVATAYKGLNKLKQFRKYIDDIKYKVSSSKCEKYNEHKEIQKILYQRA